MDSRDPVAMHQPGPAVVDEIDQGIPELRSFEDVLIRTRRIAPHAVLFTLYGAHVVDYIARSMEFRATDPKSHVDDITRALFQRIFGGRYTLAFNKLIKLEKTLIVGKLRNLLDAGYTLEAFVEAYEKDAKPFTTVEIDASIQLDAEGQPKRRFEIKLFTCPGQSGSVLEGRMTRATLQRYFSTRDFMGFITFASIHDATHPKRPPRYNDKVPEAWRTGWFLHLAIVDARVLIAPGTARTLANEVLGAMQEDHAFMARHLSINTRDCPVSLIENYVKVINMSYIIEQLQRDLEESERRREELERRREELERQRDAMERKARRLEKALKDAGIPSPRDEDDKDREGDK